MATSPSTSASSHETWRAGARAVAGFAVIAAAIAVVGCGAGGHAAGGSPDKPSPRPADAGSTRPAAPASSQAPVPAESNPPGDIPDTTVYVPFAASAAHASLKVPEGWSRKQTANSFTFTSNLNSIAITWKAMTSAPSVSTVRGSTVPALSHSSLAFRLRSVRAVTLRGGKAIEIVYQVNSTPNAVTGRQYRLVVERFEFFKNGRAAMLSLSAAVGSDNVDPWRIVSQSFRWA